MAIEIQPDQWKRVPDGTPLPPVLQVVRVLCQCDGLFKRVNGTCSMTEKPCGYCEPEQPALSQLFC